MLWGNLCTQCGATISGYVGITSQHSMLQHHLYVRSSRPVPLSGLPKFAIMMVDVVEAWSGPIETTTEWTHVAVQVEYGKSTLLHMPNEGSQVSESNLVLPFLSGVFFSFKRQASYLQSCIFVLLSPATSSDDVTEACSVDSCAAECSSDSCGCKSTRCCACRSDCLHLFFHR